VLVHKMKHSISRAMAAIVIGVLFCGYANSQTSPKYGIRYESNGWDNLPDKFIEKRARKLERKFGPSVAADWRFNAERLRHFPRWIDEQWEARVLAWSRCHFVGAIDPRRFTITIEDGTFTLPQYPELHFIWGTVDTGATHIRLSAWAFIKSKGWTVNAVDTLAWEFGNSLQVLLMGLPNDPNKEIGSRDPCQ
jgi:hypothetical protein